MACERISVQKRKAVSVRFRVRGHIWLFDFDRKQVTGRGLSRGEGVA